MGEGDQPGREGSGDRAGGGAAPREQPDRSDRTRLRPPAWPALLVALALGLGFLVHLRRWSFLCDDAFISFRYARNLAQHGALVYNVDPLERVEGYSNLLWVLVLAAGDVIGLRPEQLAPILSAAASLASLGLVALISAALRRRFGPRFGPGQPDPRAFEIVDLLAPSLLVLTPEFVVWGSGGLEGSFALALGLGAVFAWLRGRIELAAGLAALAGLTRFDSLLWIAGFGLGWLAVVAVETPRRVIPWRRVIIASLVFAAPLVAQLVVRWLYYGEWLPNTWAVKHHGALLRDSYGLGYLRFWADRLALIAVTPLVLLLRPRHLILALPIAVQLIWAWSIGGDFMAYGRFLLPATTLLALLIGLAIGEAREQLRAWAASKYRMAEAAFASLTVDAAWAAVALALLIPSALRIPDRLAEDRDHAHLHIDYAEAQASPGFEGVTAMHRFAAVRLAAGAAFAEQLPPGTRITVGAAGALPYASGLPAYDAYGLIDPTVVAATEPRVDRARPGHQIHASIETMLAREPDLLCHIGYAGERKPTRALARRMRAPREWTGWACVETGGAERQYYCCIRPVDRFEELDPNRRGTR